MFRGSHITRRVYPEAPPLSCGRLLESTGTPLTRVLLISWSPRAPHSRWGPFPEATLIRAPSLCKLRALPSVASLAHWSRTGTL